MMPTSEATIIYALDAALQESLEIVQHARAFNWAREDIAFWEQCARNDRWALIEFARMRDQWERDRYTVEDAAVRSLVAALPPGGF